MSSCRLDRCIRNHFQAIARGVRALGAPSRSTISRTAFRFVLALAVSLLRSTVAFAHGSSEQPIEDQVLILHQNEKPISLPPEELWSLHFQSTLITQYHPTFQAKYTGTNSMATSESAATAVVATIFGASKVYEGLDLIFNPELAGGRGLSRTLGVAAYPNGEVYRVGDPAPAFVVARLLLRQTIGLGGDKIQIEPGANQLASRVDSNRLTVYAGRLALADVFDGNPYSHDSHSQFLGWGLMESAAWDYAADTHGYTWGMMADLAYNWWSIRLGGLLVGQYANLMAMEWRFWKAGSINGEFEARWKLRSRPGAVRVAAFLNDARMGDYGQALSQSPARPDVTTTRAFGRIKYGVALSFNQEIIHHGLGLFSRLSWNDGHTESWSYTEVDRSFAIGTLIDGNLWRRPADDAGIAVVESGISDSHRRYLAAGGHGFIIGDGALNYSPEIVGEVYYKAQLTPNFALSGIYQPVINPAYNQDRGPVHFLGFRIHAAF